MLPTFSINRSSRLTVVTSTMFSLFFVAMGCDSQSSRQTTTAPADQVVVYCSVDTEFAEPILGEFEKRTGIKVFHQFDTEAGKTTGLVNKLVNERAAPRADVFWSSEIFGTLQLARQGILAPYRPKTADDIPVKYHDKGDLWTAFGLRGRVIAYDPKRTKPDELPKRWCDLADPKYKGKIAMADPRFGTTRGHMATLLSLWGPDAMKKFYEALRANEYRKADGNSHAVLLLTRGAVDFAATDTDDVIVAKARGDSIEMILPDLDAPDGKRPMSGTLWIPNSVAMVKSGSHPEAAKKLIDYLTSEEIEMKLAKSESRNRPVRLGPRLQMANTDSSSPPKSGWHSYSVPFQGTEADIDYVQAAAVLEQSDKLVADILLH